MKLLGKFSALVILTFSFCLIALSDDQPALSDEFDSPDTLSKWSNRDQVEGGRVLSDKIDIGESRKGWLTIVPKSGTGWYRDGMGPMLFRIIEGDFLVETRVEIKSRNAENQPPQANFNSAGLIVRNPESGQGTQNWVVVNVGKQNPDLGTEVKTTTNSDSVLSLQPDKHNGRLRLARIGTTIYALKKLDGESEWTLIRQFSRPDLPAKVQVGLMCNGWGSNGDAIAHFDYVRYSVPKSPSDLSVEKAASDS